MRSPAAARSRGYAVSHSSSLKNSSRLQLLFQLLLVVEGGVVAVEGEQFVVGAVFDDVSVVEDGDAVGVAHGGDAVGDEDGGASLHELAQAVEDLVLGVGIDAGESVIEHQDTRLPNDGAGDGDTLLLSSGEGEAALADHGFVLFGEALDIGGDAGDGGGAADLRIACVLDAEGDVFADGGAEEKGFLRDEADAAAQGF